jgi:cell division protein FtsB
VLAVALASLLVLGGAVIWRASAIRPVPEQAKIAAPPRDPVLVQLVENTKALEESQQQAIDQLQVLQDLVRAQQAETKKASDRVAALNARLDTLQQAFASIAPPVAEEAVPEKAEPQARSRGPTRVKAASRSSRAKRQRTARRR